METPIYQVDAFASKPFAGNPAAVCPLKFWLPDATLQAIAAENNLSETAFIIEEQGGFSIRWFTPKTEVDLCGHATLATAHVMYQHLGYDKPELTLNSKSGRLSVSRQGNQLVLDFPADDMLEAPEPKGLFAAIGKEPEQLFRGKTDYMLVFDDFDTIRTLNPDFGALNQVAARGIIVTAPDEEAGYHFCSRFFAPQSGINEDPVTGSAHTSLLPYWSNRLGETTLVARQLSQRGGTLYGEYLGKRVKLGGTAVTYMKGHIFV